MSEYHQTDNLPQTTVQNECYSCAHVRAIAGDCHVECANPDPEMTGDPRGAMRGWFGYPHNFDPTWKTKRCSNYEKKGGTDHE